eukprot:TRINITY_DN8201_c0_g4_i1.p1 TRINITY_DN8201_c0_g4~~TRINITY_DN8201_c0_g4_i1.p1  ORF type:complete len:516 (+),score=8.49 TRINITY_DN8201_c0_g4_i1:374-1921(+)
MSAKLLKESAYELTLLCVSDAPIFEHIQKLLQRFFKEIIYLEDRKKVLELCREKSVDILLVDVDNKETRGCFFTEIPKDIDRHIGIIPMSKEYENPNLLLDLIQIGVDGFVKKPLEDEELLFIMAKTCEKVLNNQILFHYLDGLEKLQQEILEIKSRDRKSENFLIEERLEPTLNYEEDDFEFFPVIEEKSASLNDDIYKDYFDFLQPDDREELHDRLDEIDTAMLYAFEKSENAERYFEKLGNELVKFSGVLMHYQFFGDMGVAILELGKLIETEANALNKNAENLQMYISGFCSVLQAFMREVWEENSGNPKFLNDSVINDAGMLIGMIMPDKTESSDDGIVFFQSNNKEQKWNFMKMKICFLSQYLYLNIQKMYKKIFQSQRNALLSVFIMRSHKTETLQIKSLMRLCSIKISSHSNQMPQVKRYMLQKKVQICIFMRQNRTKICLMIVSKSSLLVLHYHQRVQKRSKMLTKATPWGDNKRTQQNFFNYKQGSNSERQNIGIKKEEDSNRRG